MLFEREWREMANFANLLIYSCHSYICRIRIEDLSILRKS